MIRAILNLFSGRKQKPVKVLQTEQREVGLKTKGFWDSILEANAVYIESIMSSMNVTMKED
jgi:hypothetical protein